MIRRGDAAFEAWVEEARSLPLEAGLLGHAVDLKRMGRELVGPCPVCGGHDRFAINDAKGVWNCRGCGLGGGDAISLTMHLEGCGFLEAVEALTGEPRPLPHARHRWPYLRPEQPTGRPSPGEGTPGVSRAAWARHSQDDEARDRRSARRIVNGLVAVRGTPGERYLAEVRKIHIESITDVLARTDAIGWHPAVYFNEEGQELHGHKLGCIVGIMTDPITARPTGAISRTYIGPDGLKITKAKTLGRPQGILRLSAGEDVGDGLHLAEGLETSLTAMALGFRPLWATGSTALMRCFPVLPGIEALTILADRDASGAGEEAAQAAARRWRSAGREVRIRRLRKGLGDINDAVRG
jgi:hypothetical protein